jgi:glyoxylase-like metal-dependent hydrolase (beta-lactamase superfamily II)
VLKLIKIEVGPWPMNSYIVIEPNSNTSAIIDPGADPEIILNATSDTKISAILLTHGHPDHVGGLYQLKRRTDALVYLHPLDAKKFNLEFDVAVADGDQIKIGDDTIRIIHTPGHTPGQVSFDLGDGRIIVGDTIFVGGPGRTWSAEDFSKTMDTMENIVFQWDDETKFFPGHGPHGKIGIEKSAFEKFLSSGWSPNLYGDVTWE